MESPVGERFQDVLGPPKDSSKHLMHPPQGGWSQGLDEDLVGILEQSKDKGGTKKQKARMKQQVQSWASV